MENNKESINHTHFSLLQQIFDTILKTLSILILYPLLGERKKACGYTQIGAVLCNKGPIQTPALPSCLSALIKRPVSHDTAGTPRRRGISRSPLISLGGTTLSIMKWEAELMNHKRLWIIMFKRGGLL